MTRNKNSYRALIGRLQVGESVTFAKAAKVATLRATAYAVSRDSGKTFTVSAPTGRAVKVTRTK